MRFFCALVLALVLASGLASAAGPSHEGGGEEFPRPLSAYPVPAEAQGLWTTLVQRVETEPFNLVATIVFLLAIIHTFLAPTFLGLAHRVQHAYVEKLRAQGVKEPEEKESVLSAFLHYLGEVEAVFGIWVLPLILLITFWKGWEVALHYVNYSVSYIEPIFVVAIMTVASSRPVMRFAEQCIAIFAGKSPQGWWLSILTLGPILGSFITEPAAMTICALLLAKQFYELRPGAKFMYATLGLLFVNVSVGGTLTHFAAPPVLMVAGPDKWAWSSGFMMMHFGIRAIIGILICNAAYFYYFRKEFQTLQETMEVRDAADAKQDPSGHDPVPGWVTGAHFAFLAAIVILNHYPVFVVGMLLFFIAFQAATAMFQSDLRLRTPLLVGFFLAGLVIHGGLQKWWIAPVLGSLDVVPLLIGATILTAFNDNAAITYLAALVPNFSFECKLAVMSGAVAGGGLTVIANAPNPAGQSILSKYFPDGVSPAGLALGAIGPTLVMLLVFGLFR